VQSKENLFDGAAVHFIALVEIKVILFFGSTGLPSIYKKKNTQAIFLLMA